MSASSDSGQLAPSRKEKKRRSRVMRWLASWQQGPGDQTDPSSKDPDDNQLESGVEDAGSIRSRRSNRSAQSAKSRGSVSSFRSIASHVSRLSRMSGSSQRSYENPILESVQTILDLATKLEADDKRTLLGTTGRASMGREARRQCPCYEESLRRLKGQVEGYVAHPAVVYSGVHTSPMELVLQCDKVREVDHGLRAGVDTATLTLYSDLLDKVSAELASWFDGFVAMPDQQEPEPVPEPSYRAYVSSPLKHEVPRDDATGDGLCPSLQK